MNVFQAMLLGLVQGVTEFLPVSSSGHLILMREILGLESSNLLFDVLLHLGSLGAVVIALRKELLGLFRPPFKKMGALILATVPAAALGLLLSDAIEDVFGSGRWLFVTFALTAALLIITETVAKRRFLIRPLGGRQIALMGIMQAVALLPGLSRSGSTVFGGIVGGGDREEVAKFSFIMSVPIILGSAAVGLIGSATGGGLTLTVGWWETLCGAVAAFVSGFASVKLMTRIVVRANYKPLVVYLVALSVLSLIISLV